MILGLNKYNFDCSESTMTKQDLMNKGPIFDENTILTPIFIGVYFDFLFSFYNNGRIGKVEILESTHLIYKEFYNMDNMDEFIYITQDYQKFFNENNIKFNISFVITDLVKKEDVYTPINKQFDVSNDDIVIKDLLKN